MPPDLKGTLGTLIRTTINQVGAMTDAARRQARSQKQRLDTALLEARRREALANLGEILYELSEKGEIDIDELPELATAVQEVAEIDRRIVEAEEEGRDRVETRRPVRLGRTSGAAGGQREQARRRPDRDRAGGRERVWRPPVDPEPQPGDRAEPEMDVEIEGRPGRGSTRAARPTGRPQRQRPAPPPARAGRGSAGAGGGGIVFVDDDTAPADVDPDDSVESYMNDDDVPRRR